MTTYSYIEGVAHRTSFISRSGGVGFAFSGAELELGEHPIADELRTLGLPKRALFTSWMEKMHATFGVPIKL